MKVNLNQPDFFQNPYPYYAKMRASGEPVWLSHDQDSSSKGVWLFARYADAQTIFTQTGAVSKNIRAVRPPGTSTAFDLHMLHRDGPDHLRLRRLVSDYFSAQYLNQIAPHITAVAEALIHDLQEKGSFDLIADFAEQLPLHVIARLIGIPVSDMPQVRAWALALGEGFDSVMINEEVLKNQKEALFAFLGYVEEVIAKKRKDLGEDLLSFLVSAETEQAIQSDELTGMVGFLLFAGHETTINLIGNGLWLLLTHPEQWALLHRHPEMIRNAVEEILRFESPEQRTSFRIAVEPVEIAGMWLRPGQQLGVVIGSANRDEAVFAEADVFDIQRTPNRHLAFGVGLHHCLGKTLARLEGRLVLSSIIKLCPSLRLIEDRPQWRKNSFFRGLQALPATLR